MRIFSHDSQFTRTLLLVLMLQKYGGRHIMQSNNVTTAELQTKKMMYYGFSDKIARHVCN